VRRADIFTTFMCRLSWNLDASTSWKPQVLSMPVQGSGWYTGNNEELPVPRNSMFYCLKSRQYFMFSGTTDCWLPSWAFRSARWRLSLPTSYKFSFSERVKKPLSLIASLGDITLCPQVKIYRRFERCWGTIYKRYIKWTTIFSPFFPLWALIKWCEL